MKGTWLGEKKKSVIQGTTTKYAKNVQQIYFVEFQKYKTFKDDGV